MAHPLCASCRLWVRHGDALTTGDCHLRPPDRGRAGAGYPWTAASDWCSAHQPRTFVFLKTTIVSGVPCTSWQDIPY